MSTLTMNQSESKQVGMTGDVITGHATVEAEA